MGVMSGPFSTTSRNSARQYPAGGVVPADQGLDRDDFPGGEVENRLGVHDQLISFQRGTELGLQVEVPDGPGSPGQRSGVFRVVPVDLVLAVVLRDVHSVVGVPQEPLRTAAGIGHRDADAGAEVMHGLLAPVRLGQHGEQPTRQDGWGRIIGEIRAEHHELITAHPSDGVTGAHAVPQSLGDHQQHLVAGEVPSIVIHRLEPVEVDEVHGHALVRTVRRSQRMLQPVEQQSPVGQRSQRVVQRQMLQPLLGLLAGADVLDHSYDQQVTVVAYRGDAGLHPDVTSVGVDPPAFDIQQQGVAVGQCLERFTMQGAMIDVGEVGNCHPQQLISGVSGDLAQCRIHSQDPTYNGVGGVGEHDPHRCVVEDALEQRFAGLQGFFGRHPGGDVRANFDEPIDRAGRIAHRGGGEHRLQPPTVLGQVSPLPRFRLTESGPADDRPEVGVDTELVGAGLHLRRVVQHRRARQPDHFRRRVAQHLLRAGVEHGDHTVDTEPDDRLLRRSVQHRGEQLSPTGHRPTASPTPSAGAPFATTAAARRRRPCIRVHSSRRPALPAWLRGYLQERTGNRWSERLPWRE
jgi:hypothetical protein